VAGAKPASSLLEVVPAGISGFGIVTGMAKGIIAVASGAAGTSEVTAACEAESTSFVALFSRGFVALEPL
jgi:hypothetical protein